MRNCLHHEMKEKIYSYNGLRSGMVELYLYCPIRLHGVGVN
jgi:hypothetical protein